MAHYTKMQQNNVRKFRASKTENLMLLYFWDAGDIFRSKADIKEKLEAAENQIFFVNIPSGGVCPDNTSFSKANFNFSFFKVS